MSSDDFRSRFGVSRETTERLDKYEALLKKWNKAINLVGRSTIDDIWARHFTDSAEVFSIAEKRPGKWVDLGSGPGLPGIVLAAICAEKLPDNTQVCVEADLRKCEFMRTALRDMKIQAGVFTRRIEDTPNQNADVITARALAPLTKLLEHANRHLDSAGICIFHKGERWLEEIQEAKKDWSFDLRCHHDLVSKNSVLLEIGEIQRV